MSIAGFVSYLVDRGLVDVTHTGLDNDKGIRTLIYIQVFAFFVRYFGADLGYKFDIYIVGPYSSRIEEEYESLDYANLPSPQMPQGLDEGKFLSVFGNRKYKWLAIAGVMLRDRMLSPDIECNMIADPEHGVTDDLIETVRKELIKFNLY